MKLVRFTTPEHRIEIAEACANVFEVFEREHLANARNYLAHTHSTGVFTAGDVKAWKVGEIIDAQAFVGTIFRLDPCGKAHHLLSPNDVTAECLRFWESLRNQLRLRNLHLIDGEGDPCEQFVGRVYPLQIESKSEEEDIESSTPTAKATSA